MSLCPRHIVFYRMGCLGRGRRRLTHWWQVFWAPNVISQASTGKWMAILMHLNCDCVRVESLPNGISVDLTEVVWGGWGKIECGHTLTPAMKTVQFKLIYGNKFSEKGKRNLRRLHEVTSSEWRMRREPILNGAAHNWYGNIGSLKVHVLWRLGEYEQLLWESGEWRVDSG